MQCKAFVADWFEYLCALLHFTTFAALFFLNSERFVFSLSQGHVSLLIVLSTISFITSIAHIVYACNRQRMSRFLEYSITAPLMAFVIAVLVGIENETSLLGIAACIASTMPFGYLEEQLAETPVQTHPHYFGYIPYLSAWIMITREFYSNSSLPLFVSVIFITQLLLFSSFGIVQSYYLVREPNRPTDMNNMYGAYNLLSLLSKMTLVWLCVGGMTRQ